MSFIGREAELNELNRMYEERRFHLFILYGRRRVGKTTLLAEFCRDKPSVFYSAEQSNDKLNLEKFSAQIFEFCGEATLSPFTSWTKAITWLVGRQGQQPFVLVLDEFPYLARRNPALLSELQHLIDHQLKASRMFFVLCGSYMGFMEKEILSAKSPLFGRRTGQLHMKSLDYSTSLRFLEGFEPQEQLQLYAAFGGTPLYLEQVRREDSFEQNIRNSFLKATSYLYEEPLLLLRQEVQEPGIYNAVIEAIAGGASHANEIATRIGEESAKCLKYIQILCELGILCRETPFGEKANSRKSIYRIADPMFRFWYRYVFRYRSLIESGAADAVWRKRIEPDYANYMGLAFEQICMQYLQQCNARGELPVLCTQFGRWWGTNPQTRRQEEIDIVAGDGKDHLFCECKWRASPADLSVLQDLQRKAEVSRICRGGTWYVLFSKSGFTQPLREQAQHDRHLMLVSLEALAPPEP